MDGHAFAECRDSFGKPVSRFLAKPRDPLTEHRLQSFSHSNSEAQIGGSSGRFSWTVWLNALSLDQPLSVARNAIYVGGRY